MQIKKYTLIKICLIVFLITFTLIYIIESNNEKKIISISQINKNNIEKNVKIEGKITKQTLNKNNLFFTIKDNSSQINCIAFKTNQALEKNKIYTIEGKVVTYNKELEIIVNKIEEKN